MTNRTPSDATRQRRRLAEWLRAAAGMQEQEVTALQIHLGDLYLACADVLATVDQLAGLDTTRDAATVRRALAHLEGQLYEHMLPHMTELRPTLEALTSRLYAAADEGGENESS